MWVRTNWYSNSVRSLWALGLENELLSGCQHCLNNICYLENELQEELIIILYKIEQKLTSSVGINTEERGSCKCLTCIYHLTWLFSTCVHWAAKLLVPAQLSVRHLSQGRIKAQDGIKCPNLCTIDGEKKMWWDLNKWSQQMSVKIQEKIRKIIFSCFWHLQ